MNKEYRKKLFDILDQIDELAGPVEEMQERTAGESRKEAVQKDEDGESCKAPNHDTRKRYSSEFKKMVVRMHRDEGRTCESITNEYGVSKATITKWCSDARYENRAKLDEQTRELQNIIKENQKMKKENAFLKKILILLFGKEMEGLA